ncbi:hypothetical protein D9M69_359750 [compost metagenome]
MGRAEHRQALDLSAVEQLAGDESPLDGLADTDVVGNQQAHRGQLQCHQQRHELVSPRLNRDVTETTEGPRTTSQLELQGI